MSLDSLILEVLNQQKQGNDSLSVGEKLKLVKTNTLRLSRFDKAYEALNTARLSLNYERKSLSIY